MGFKIDGTDWTPKTTSQHATSITENMNQLLRERNVRDKQGNLVQITANFSNALYLLILGFSERCQDNDNDLVRAINSFNIELCDDQQIENLLPIAATGRKTGSYSTLTLIATASETGSCTIPAGTSATFGDVKFIVNTEHIIQAGESQEVETTCDTVGPVTVLSGEITAFDTQIPNLDTVENQESSVPGVNSETTNELRQRLIIGDTIKYSLSGCKEALEELTGIAYARVYFNYNTTETITLPGGVVLQPRTAYIVIHGDSDKIAETYAEYMSAPTQNAPGATTTAKSQNYVTSSGQIIEIKYDEAAEQEVWVKVVLKEGAESGTAVENQIKRDLIQASANWKIGEQVTSLLTGEPFVNCTYTDVAYTLISDDGETWENIVEVGCNVIPRAVDAKIVVEDQA